MNRIPSIRSAFSATLLALGIAAGAARAQGIHKPDLVTGGNRWTITFFNDASPVHVQWATQGLCFRYLGMAGTHARYQWWSDTYPDWNGIATQEGDEITMYGDYAQNTGHDGIKWDLVTASAANMGAGHWWEWRENGGIGNPIGFGNARLQRVTNACLVSYENSPYIPYPLDQNGNQMLNPAGNYADLPTVP